MFRIRTAEAVCHSHTPDFHQVCMAVFRSHHNVRSHHNARSHQVCTVVCLDRRNRQVCTAVCLDRRSHQVCTAVCLDRRNRRAPANLRRRLCISQTSIGTKLCIS